MQGANILSPVSFPKQEMKEESWLTSRQSDPARSGRRLSPESVNVCSAGCSRVLWPAEVKAWCEHRLWTERVILGVAGQGQLRRLGRGVSQVTSTADRLSPAGGGGLWRQQYGLGVTMYKRATTWEQLNVMEMFIIVFLVGDCPEWFLTVNQLTQHFLEDVCLSIGEMEFVHPDSGYTSSNVS